MDRVDRGALLNERGVRPVHGGDLAAFCQRYQCSPEAVLDLSSAVSPWAWPAPDLSEQCWQQLPQQHRDVQQLQDIAAQYYGAEASQVLPLAGSQMAIELLPQCLAAATRVALPCWGYQEHSFGWQNAGHQTAYYGSFDALCGLVEQDDIRVAVVINPNNPTGDLFTPDQLLPLAEQLASRGGFLLVDEAFMDTTPEYSLAGLVSKPGVVVLRSVGKFFGVPGLRLGFLLAEASLLKRLGRCSPLWSVNRAAYWLGQQMLSDSQWVATNRHRLREQSVRMQQWVLKHLSAIAVPECTAPALCWQRQDCFLSAKTSPAQADVVEQHLAKSSVAVRRYTALGNTDQQCEIIRLGITDAEGLQRLMAINDCGQRPIHEKYSDD